MILAMFYTFNNKHAVCLYLIIFMLLLTPKTRAQDEKQLKRENTEETHLKQLLDIKICNHQTPKSSDQNSNIELLLTEAQKLIESDCYEQQLLTFFLTSMKEDDKLSVYNTILELFIKKLYESDFHVLNLTPDRRKENAVIQSGYNPSLLMNSNRGMYNTRKNTVYIDFNGIEDQRELLYVINHEFFHSVDSVVEKLDKYIRDVEEREHMNEAAYKERHAEILQNVAVLIKGRYIEEATLDSWIKLPEERNKTIDFSVLSHKEFRNYIIERWFPKDLYGANGNKLRVDELHDALSYIHMVCIYLIYYYIGELRAVQTASKLNADYFYSFIPVEPISIEQAALKFYDNNGQSRKDTYKQILRLITEFNYYENQSSNSRKPLWWAYLEELTIKKLEMYLDGKETESCQDNNCYFFHLLYRIKP